MKASLPRAAGSAGAEVGRLSKLKSNNASPSTAQTEDSFLPGPVLLLGAPGVGKGTQAQLLVSRFAIPQISTGDLLRQHRRNRTELGMIADDLMKQGQLVPDELVNKMVAVRLCEPDVAAGYILDGFPRTLAQAQWLDTHSPDCGNLPPTVAIEIKVDEAQLLRRITGRRTCPACNHIYNIYFNPPKQDELCDNDGTKLVQRADDTEEAFHKRMRVYRDQTMPVIPHYRDTGRFRSVEGDGSVEQVAAALLEALREVRAEFPVPGPASPTEVR
jgi:adenylate kinase